MSNSHITSIYNSRKNILEILEERDYNIESYNNFSINEISILYENDQLDMFVEHKETKKKIYIKYYADKVLKTQTLYSIVEDLFHLDNILSKNDDLIIIIKDEPNNTLNQDIKEIWMQENIYVSLLNIKRLQFNILKHSLVPKHTILTKEEEQEFKTNYNIMENNQIPDISYFSPVSLVLGIRPGNIVKIERNSKTAISSNFYRICKI